MSIGIVLLTTAAVAGLSTYTVQQLKKRREQQIWNNENRAATTIRDYARSVKTYLEDSKRRGLLTMDFKRIAVPTAAGYQLSIELSAHSFRIYGVPRTHNKTGRLSFYADGSLIVKAADKGGESANEKDDAFNRLTSEVLA